MPLSLQMSTSARSPLRNRVLISLYPFSEMFNNSLSDAGGSLKAYSLAYKVLKDLTLMYLSSFLPGDLLSYHSAWPKGDICFPCELAGVLQRLGGEVVRKWTFTGLSCYLFKMALGIGVWHCCPPSLCDLIQQGQGSK